MVSNKEQGEGTGRRNREIWSVLLYRSVIGLILGLMGGVYVVMYWGCKERNGVVR